MASRLMSPQPRIMIENSFFGVRAKYCALGMASTFCIEPDLCPHAGQGHTDFLVVDVAVVRAMQREAETIWVAGIG